MRRLLLLILVVVAACSDNGGDADGADAARAGGDAPAVRFCDAFLDYLSEATSVNLEAVVSSAPADEEVADFAAIIDSDDPVDRVVAAGVDLEDLARRRCQAEWTAGAQGAGNAAAAAEALVDALRAGDRMGARNVASANAIAVFEPWDPIDTDDDVAVLDVEPRSFGIVLGDRLAECQVETGVVIACTVKP